MQALALILLYTWSFFHWSYALLSLEEDLTVPTGNIFVKGPDFVGFRKQKIWTPLFENLSSLGGVLIKFFGNSWKHGNPRDYFGFEIFDFRIVLGRLILAGTFLGLLDLCRDFGGYSKLMFVFFVLYHSQWLFVWDPYTEVYLQLIWD